MAGSSLLTLIDDIAALLDDIAVMSKVAAKKTAGVLGDDLALNAQQVTGVNADRELPVVWAVAKGSFINKLILVPLALLISSFAPVLVLPLLMIGGLFLCYEGAEKIFEAWLHPNKADTDEDLSVIDDMAEFERQKVKGAIRTDFILSAEIIVISLGTVAQADLTSQILVLSVIALGMTVGVYGLVAGIVKIDDLGLYLTKKSSLIKQKIGQALLSFAPWLMKTLSVVGTAAMFLVGGGIVVHGIDPLHHGVEHTVLEVAEHMGSWVTWILPTLINGVLGVFAGAIITVLIATASKAFKKN